MSQAKDQLPGLIREGRACVTGAEMADPARAIKPPSTFTEAVLAHVWREVTGLDEVGVHDNFFDLGGNSLLAARLMAKTSHAAGRHIPLRDLLEGPTIAELSVKVEKGASRPQVPTPVRRPSDAWFLRAKAGPDAS